MAVVSDPCLSIAASGSVGTINFTRYRGMAIGRLRGGGTITPSTQQLAYRGIWGTIQVRWHSTLTATQREAWNKVSAQTRWKNRLSQEYSPTGFQLFMQTNFQRWRVSMAYTNDPITEMTPYYLKGFTLTPVSSVPRIEIYPIYQSGLAQPYAFQIWRAGPVSAGITSPGKNIFRYRFTKIPATDFYDTAVVAGSVYWYRLRGVSDNATMGNFFQYRVVI